MGAGASPMSSDGAAVGGAFTGLPAGNLADHVGDDPVAVAQRRAAVLSALPRGVTRLRFARQVHGTDVHEVTAPDLDAEPRSVTTLDLEADALVTRVPGLALGVVVADCAPVLLLDDRAGIVAVAHAGRRGAQGGVVPAAVAAALDLGADDLRAIVGPSVCGRCYEVPDELRREVGASQPAMVATTSWGTPSLDVSAGVVAQLGRLGVRAAVHPACTREDDAWFSVRRDGAETGRGAGVVWTATSSWPQP